MLWTIVVILLILMLIGAYPSWGYNSTWGYGPFGGFLGAVVLIVILLVVFRVL